MARVDDSQSVPVDEQADAPRLMPAQELAGKTAGGAASVALQSDADGDPESQRPDGRGAAKPLVERAVTGAIWTIATSLGSRVLGLAGTLLLTRFLAPDVYGEVSLAAVVVLTAQIVSNCGLSQYIVSKPREGRAAAFHATFYFMILGVVALGLVVIARHPLGPLIGAPNMGRFIPGLAFAAILERIGMIQDRIQVRDMRFRSLGLQRSIGEVTYAVVAVALAMYGGFNDAGNAVVWACIARSAVRLVTLSATTPRREWLEPCRITWARTRDLFAFGLPMSVATLAGFGSRKWDNLIFARAFGQSAAGIYNLAYSLADVPATQIGETIGDVLVPSFAKMKSEERRQKALLLSMRLLTLIVAPLGVGLGVVAPTVVAAFFDPRWAGVAPMLVVLSALSVVRPLGWIGSSYLQVKNKPRAIMVLEISKTASLLVSMVVLGRLGGPLWACAAVGVTFAVNSLGYLWVIKRVDGISLRAQLVPLIPPLVACAPMALAVVGVRYALRAVAPGAVPIGVALLVELLVGAIVFIPSALLLAPTTSRELLNLLRTGLRGRGSEAPAG